MPATWRMIAGLTLYFFVLLVLVVTFLFTTVVLHDAPDRVSDLLMAGLMVLVALQAWLQVTFAMRILSDHQDELRALRWAFLVIMPLVALIVVCNVVVSCFSRRIVWRGIGYELISPTRTVIWKRDLPSLHGG
jgi:ceramide glucosyltransferase